LRSRHREIRNRFLPFFPDRKGLEIDNSAYERNSLIVTTNLPFENWTEDLGSKRLTGAALDRRTHRCHILETKGESYRLQDAKRRRRRTD
jgi:DNA replication protein DnaC